MTDSGSSPSNLVSIHTQSPAPAPDSQPSAKSIPDVFFTRAEFDAILRVYGRKVVDGEWRDYSIGASKDAAVFAVHRRSGETPLYRIEKRPKLARRQGAFSVVAATGLILKRGHELAQVLKMFEKRKLSLIDA